MDNIPHDELISAYLDGELNAEEHAQAESLLAESAAARQLLEELRILSAGLRALPRMKLALDFRERVLQRAEQERQQTAAAAAPAPADDAGNRVRPAVGNDPANDQISWRRRILRVVMWPVLATAAALAIFYFDPNRSSREDGNREVAIGQGDEAGNDAKAVRLRQGMDRFSARDEKRIGPAMSATPPADFGSDASDRKIADSTDRAPSTEGAGMTSENAALADNLNGLPFEYRAGAQSDDRLSGSAGRRNATLKQLAKEAVEDEPAIEFVLASESADVASVDRLFAQAEVAYEWTDTSEQFLGLQEAEEAAGERLKESGDAVPGSASGGGLGAANAPAGLETDKPAIPVAGAPPAAPAAAVVADENAPAEAGEMSGLYEEVALEIVGTPAQIERLVAAARADSKNYVTVGNSFKEARKSLRSSLAVDEADDAESEGQPGDVDDNSAGEAQANGAKGGVGGGSGQAGANRSLAENHRRLQAKRRQQSGDSPGESSAARSAKDQDAKFDDDSSPALLRVLSLESAKKSYFRQDLAKSDDEPESDGAALDASSARKFPALVAKPSAANKKPDDSPSKGEVFAKKDQAKKKVDASPDNPPAAADGESKSLPKAEKSTSETLGSPLAKANRVADKPSTEQDVYFNAPVNAKGKLRVILVFRAAKPTPPDAQTLPASPAAEPQP